MEFSLHSTEKHLDSKYTYEIMIGLFWKIARFFISLSAFSTPNSGTNSGINLKNLEQHDALWGTNDLILFEHPIVTSCHWTLGWCRAPAHNILGFRHQTYLGSRQGKENHILKVITLYKKSGNTSFLIKIDDHYKDARHETVCPHLSSLCTFITNFNSSHRYRFNSSD